MAFLFTSNELLERETKKKNLIYCTNKKNKVLRAARSVGGGGKWGKEGEGVSQRTCMNDPWAWTTGWGLTVGAGRGEQRGKFYSLQQHGWTWRTLC